TALARVISYRFGLVAEPLTKPITLDAAINGLKHVSEAVRLATLRKILAAKAGAQMLDCLARCLDDSSERIRRAAVVLLGETGAAAAGVLAHRLDDKQPAAVRSLTASMLARLGAEASPAMDALVTCLTANEEDLRLNAALALG